MKTDNVRRRLLATAFIVALLICGASYYVLMPIRGGPNHDVTRSRIDLECIRSALVAYYGDYGTLPSGDAATIIRRLKGENPKRNVYIAFPARQNLPNGLIADRWGTPIKIEVTQDMEVLIQSAGPNRQLGDQDDLVKKEKLVR